MYGYKLTEKGKTVVAALVGTTIQVLIMTLAENNAVTAFMLLSWGLSILFWYGMWQVDEGENSPFYQYVLLFVFSLVAIPCLMMANSFTAFLKELVEPVEKSKRKNDEIN